MSDLEIGEHLKSVTLASTSIEILGDELGRGSYGKVFTAKYCGELFAAKEVHSILLEPGNNQKLKSSFLRECYYFSKIRHPKIVQMIGVHYPTDIKKVPILVMELMKESLTTLIERSTSIKREFKLSILYDVSEGLCYLHSQPRPILHRDLHPGNILLTDKMVAKISDLGQAKTLPTSQEAKLTKVPGNIHFMPPEATDDNPKYNTALDVFSFGGIVLFVVNQEWPIPLHPTLIDKQTGILSVQNEVDRRHYYLDLMGREFGDLRPLVEQCLDNDHEKRPSIQGVLSAIKQKMSIKGSGSEGACLVDKKSDSTSYGDECFSCGGDPTIYCTDCKGVMCDECSDLWHRNQKRLTHNLQLLNEESDSKGVNSDHHKKESFEVLLKQLNIFDNYAQRKFTLKDAMTIHKNLLNDKMFNNIAKDSLDPFYIVLQRVMMYGDYRNVIKRMSETNEHCKINPSDFLLALLHSCDNFLRQDILSRLSNCQFAIPLLLPNPDTKKITFLLWALRGIVCGWKCSTDAASESTTLKESCIVDCNTQIISFLRVGKASQVRDFSKSEIINNLIGKQIKHFFSRHCEGGSFERKITDGLLEFFAFYPSGKDNDSFRDRIFFINLRGEACQHSMQIDFIKKVSFMSIVFLLENTISSITLALLESLASLPGGLVILFRNYKRAIKLPGIDQLITTVNVVSVDLQKTDGDINSVVRKLISSKIKVNRSKAISLYECAVIARKIGLHIDEDDENCNCGLKLAKAVMANFPQSENTDQDFKATLLPLQGEDLWQKWAQCNKDLYRSPASSYATFTTQSENTTSKYCTSLTKQCKDIRKKQYNQVNGTPFMKCFVKHLQESTTTNDTQLSISEKGMYFLYWVKMLLDDRSRRKLPRICAQYKKLKKKLMAMREQDTNDTKNSEHVKLIQCLKKQNDKLKQTSLGLEHLFRELGQMYEAEKECNHNKSQYNKTANYPKMMVDILNQGFAIELMDGDASHIPTKWVSAILDELIKAKGDKKVFVISVVGLQSSGKSTLLNAMFGSQFKVYAGRCTRGAFIQLLPIKKLPADKECFGYALIVDTEGLRAAELGPDQSQHDNELATFVIGLANMAIVNIKGESPGDLNDILDISIHAFIKMKKVSKDDISCQIVHHNVEASSAHDKLISARHEFQQNLNLVTKTAAEALKCENKYRRFQDVIKLDENNGIMYFPGFWKSRPPMGAVSDEYGEMALELKTHLVECMEKSRKTFGEFKSTVEILWEAVCEENFLFSFKNSLEVTAYSALDSEYCHWRSVLNQKTIEVVHKAETAIFNSDSDNLQNTKESFINSGRRNLYVTCCEVQQHVADYFERNKLSKILLQWRTTYVQKVEDYKESCLQNLQNQCNYFKQRKTDELKVAEIKKGHRQQLLNKIKQMVQQEQARQIDVDFSQHQLKKNFDDQWKQWIADFSKRKSDENIESLMEKTVLGLLYKEPYAALVHKGLETPFDMRGRDDLVFKIDTTHIESNFLKHLKSIFLKFINVYTFAQRSSDQFLAEAKEDFRNSKEDFSINKQSCAENLLQKLIGRIEQFNADNEKGKNLFTNEYIVEITLTYAGHLCIEFNKLMKTIAANDPIESLKGSKDTYFSIFCNLYGNISGIATAARNLCQLLSLAIEAEVIDTLPNKIDSEMEHIPLYSAKNTLKATILKDLARRKNFELYKVYLQDVKSSFEWWAEKYVKEFCYRDEEPNLKSMAIKLVGDNEFKINEAMKVTDSSLSVKSWLKSFHSKLSIKCDINEMEDIIVATFDDSDSKMFVDMLIQELQHGVSNITDEIKDSKSRFSEITKWTNSPHIIFYKRLIGCSAQCPFCGEQCELTDSQHLHDHYIKIHRPECLGKYKWVKSKTLVLEVCPFLVKEGSRMKFKNKDTNYEFVKFEDYRKIYSNWNISAEKHLEATKYWQWFIYHFLSEISEWVGSAPTDIDPNWKVPQDDDNDDDDNTETAIQSLEELYNISLTP